MQVKVFRRGCNVETHEIPPYEGRGLTWPDPTLSGDIRLVGGSELVPGTEGVLDVVDRFEFDPMRGGRLSRRVRTERDWGGTPRAAVMVPSGYSVVVAPEEVADVVRIDVDGEQVWPEVRGGGVEEIRALAEQLVGGGSID